MQDFSKLQHTKARDLTPDEIAKASEQIEHVDAREPSDVAVVQFIPKAPQPSKT
jgi:hypothetical protein